MILNLSKMKSESGTFIITADRVADSVNPAIFIECSPNPKLITFKITPEDLAIVQAKPSSTVYWIVGGYATAYTVIPGVTQNASINLHRTSNGLFYASGLSADLSSGFRVGQFQVNTVYMPKGSFTWTAYYW